MLFSKAFIPTKREDPSEADAVSHKLLVRAGFIRKVAAGIYEWMPLGLKVLKKIEQIVREEMNAADAQEVWLPIVQPKELWEQSGRWGKYGRELLRIKDRKDAEFCLAPTAEEVMTEMVASNVTSWRSLPLCLYQFGTKFRDEVRPRFGVMRGREFYMKDAYSFHADEQDAERYYERMREAYSKSFDRIGLRYRMVEADSGAIGGNFSHEFMVLSETGEDQVVHCSSCPYAANLERAETKAPPNHTQSIGGAMQVSEGDSPRRDVPTPGAFTVQDVSTMLKIPADRFVKTLFYWAGKKPVVCLLRGDHELNEIKLKKLFGGEDLKRMNDEEYMKLAQTPVGFAGPQGLQSKAKKFHPEAQVVADFAVTAITDGVSGANKKDFHTEHLSYKRDFDADQLADLRLAVPKDVCPRCGKGELVFQRGIEVGHIFKLGIKYSKPMNATYLNKEKQPTTMVMGTYGIGVSRIEAAAIEQNHDENGILWPRSIAPYEIVVTCVDMDDPAIAEAAKKIYEGLKAKGIDVLFDDRDERPGVKFKDADLLGIPLRIVVGKRNMAAGNVEIKLRNVKTPELVAATGAVDASLRALDGYKL